MPVLLLLHVTTLTSYHDTLNKSTPLRPLSSSSTMLCYAPFSPSGISHYEIAINENTTNLTSEAEMIDLSKASLAHKLLQGDISSLLPYLKFGLKLLVVKYPRFMFFQRDFYFINFSFQWIRHHAVGSDLFLTARRSSNTEFRIVLKGN